MKKYLIVYLLLPIFSFSSLIPANAANPALCPGAMAMPMDMTSHPAHSLGDGTSLNAVGYQMNIIEQPNASKNTKTLKFNILGYDNLPLKKYTLDMGKILHLLVYSSDFKTYIHVHPQVDKNGTFTYTLPLTQKGTYHYITDISTPINDKTNPTVQLIFGGSFDYGTKTALTKLPLPQCKISSNGYKLELSQKVLDLAHSSLMINVFDKKGNPVSFGTYLGARAHLVVFKENSLAYGHFHPMNVDGSMPIMWGKVVSTSDKNIKTFADAPAIDYKAKPDTQPGMLHFMTEPPGAGRYIAFLQFVVKGKIETTSFTFDAKDFSKK